MKITQHYKLKRLFSLFLGLTLLYGCSRASNTMVHQKAERSTKSLQKKLDQRRVKMFNGWSVSAAGRAIPLRRDLPLNMALSPNKKWMAITFNGYGKEGVKFINTQTGSVADSVRLGNAWVGLSFGASDSRVYASGGNSDQIYVLGDHHNRWMKEDSISLGKPWPKNKISPAGLDVDPSRHRLYTVTKEDSMLYVVNLKNRQVIRRVKLNYAAYTCKLSNDGNRLYISLWGGGEVAVYNIQTGKITHHITVESHPNDMALSPDGNYLYVANANSNSVSVINTRQNTVIETLNAALYPNSPTGSTTNSVALSNDGDTLYVANADNNCLAVFDVSNPEESRSLGYIPTGWYPTSVKVAKGKIWVANGKGMHSRPNIHGPNPTTKQRSKEYTGRMFTGTLSIISVPNHREMGIYSKAVYKNTPYNPHKNKNNKKQKAQFLYASPGHPSPIKHVFYIIKENRTYDQVLGDMSEGNGDPNLTLFGRRVTPNHHKLARQFVLLDNFYVNAEVSADGHNWSTAAYATDYVNKTWPTYYSGRGGNYDYEGGRKIAFPKKGFIWNYCKRAGVSYRSYGEFANLGNPHLKVLKGHTDLNYPGFDLSVTDTLREHRWEQDFDSLLARHEVPQFQTIRLPDDHTAGARVDSPTPQAYVADNDLALGKLIQHLSHSSIWKSSVVFVLEDDAQDGPDHVDAHRSVCLVAGPYVKRHAVVHAMYSTSSVLHTIERILGLPPMSQYDAAAPLMTKVFTTHPDTAAYQALPNNINLDKKNKKHDALSRESAHFDFSGADEAPDVPFDRVIWKTVKGIHSKMPAPRHSAFLMVHENSSDKGDQDDD
ncbi:MAG TPA: bifunctional YncE family protein/alkaline phosphatase family protein [Balneolaceae bacterium]|nr:bifunctional YncE family protein/alkaline phosphatase family protein [Balneolaceae bacterium]